MGYPEFDATTVYYMGDVVWFGELAYRAKGLVIGGDPSISKKWKVHVRCKPFLAIVA